MDEHDGDAVRFVRLIQNQLVGDVLGGRQEIQLAEFPDPDWLSV